VSDQLQFDEEASRAVEALYSTGDVVAQRRVILETLGLREGQRVLDIGCGPGFLASEMAGVVGAGGAVHGIDVSPSMLEVAARRDAAEGAAPIELSEQDASHLSFPDASFDVAVSTQVYEYVEDMPAALAEARRALAPGGRLAILDTDWDSIVWRSEDEPLMARVLAAWDEHLAHPHLPRRLPQLLGEAGFGLESCTVVPVLNIGYDEATYSAGAIGLIADFVAGRRGITDAESEAWAQGLRAMGERYFFGLSRYLFLARSPIP
jgi:arsenite methyltransferase